ncbi:MAG TPA: hypothetical protein PKC85_04465, partial [Bacteroidia bacterium]|nr:hypothetical protein [Bacteroidia bacterium]HMU19080.1 hypothetical protein [Bacteroidia bacterium]
MQNSKGRKRGYNDKPPAGKFKPEGRPSRGKKFGSSTDKSKEEFVKSGNNYSKNKFSGKRRFDTDESGFERKRRDSINDENAGFDKRKSSRFEGKRSFSQASDGERRERPSRFKKEGGFDREKRG